MPQDEKMYVATVPSDKIAGVRSDWYIRTSWMKLLKGFGGDFFILPSSLHEGFIGKRMMARVNYSDLKGYGWREVNATSALHRTRKPLTAYITTTARSISLNLLRSLEARQRDKGS